MVETRGEAGGERTTGVGEQPLADVLPFPRSRPPSPDRPNGAGPEPRLRDLVGRVLREERLDQGRTLADVAEESAVSLPYLSEVERGRKEVSSDLLAAICDALEIPLVEVLQRSADRLRSTGAGGSDAYLLAA
jgi:ribosome-binding protein aMBF1 (putative translation factor)